VFYWLVELTLGTSLKIMFRPRSQGKENVPRRGLAILAFNRLSVSDHFFGPLPLPRKVVFLAKAEYFTGRGLKGLLSKAFFSGTGQIPVDSGRRRRRRAGDPREPARARQGNVLGIYPEAPAPRTD
jgi:1-acyl-sn-glycerol-3-phosphate acyltransferase